MPKHVILDFETRGVVDLRKVGAARYAVDPHTDVWCVAFAVDAEPVQLWRPCEPVPPELIEAATDPDCKSIAHNAGFERAILRHVLAPPLRYGWPDIPVERWRCTMSMALALALPAALGKLADVLGLAHQKGDDKIMHLLAKPRRPRGDEDPAKGPYWFDDAERLAELYRYCAADVECERELFSRLSPLSDAEQSLWQLDQIINDRGFYVDGMLLEKSIAIATAAEQAVQTELQQITSGEIETTNQVDKLLAWLAARGCEVKDLQKATLSAALRRTSLTPEVRRVIELRREAAHASANKMQALQAWRHVDGRVRGCFRYHGAATGRWSGSGPQPQNFRRESENTPAKLAAVTTGDIEQVRQLGAPIEIVGDIARAAIGAAPPGRRLLIGDFSGIESRVLAWIAGEPSKLDQWSKFDRTHDPADDPYVLIGRALGHPEDTARAKGKVADLAFGYQGGKGAYKNFAPADDTATELQIEAFKLAWRNRHPQITQFWRGIDRAAVAAVRRAPAPIDYGRLTLQCEQRDGATFLFITLPSGRRLSYPFPKLITNRFGDPAVEFQDNSIINGAWTPCNHGLGAYGGLWTENIVSGIARDLLAAAIQRLEAAAYPVVLHVHDEIVCELPAREGSLDEFKYLIERLPEWAAGLPITAKVRNGPRFAEVDAPVLHVPGSLEAPPPRARANKAASAKGRSVAPAVLPEPLPADPEVFERFVRYVIERHAICQRREAGQPPPWTDDPILAAERFCNDYRELDRTTIDLTRIAIEPNRDNPDSWFIVLVTRLHNFADVASKLIAADCLTPFDPARYRAVIEAFGPGKQYNTPAYRALLVPQALAGMKGPEYHATIALPAIWARREHLRPRADDTLQSFSDRLRECEGVGPFFAGQIVADMKHADSALRSAADFWTYVTPGPGSEPGLNRIRGRKPEASWQEWHWCLEIERLEAEVAPLWDAAGMPRLDRQNLQNTLCEHNKYEKRRVGEGRPRLYKLAGASTTKAKVKPKSPTVVEASAIEEQSTPPPTATVETVVEPDPPQPDAPPVDIALTVLDELERAEAPISPPEWPWRPLPRDVAIEAAGAAAAAAEPVPDFILAHLDAQAVKKAAESARASNEPPCAAAEPARASNVPPPASAAVPRAAIEAPPGGSRSHNGGGGGRRGNGGGGDNSGVDDDGPSNGEPFDDTYLIRKSYRLVRTFDYKLPDGTHLYEQRRYELLPAEVPSPKRPRKRFLPRYERGGLWFLGAGARRVLYNWPAVMRAGPGATVLIPEGEGKVDDLSARGLLATTVLSHAWDAECVAALAGRHLIILADHDQDGEKIAAAALAKLAPVAASVRVVRYAHLWDRLPPEQRGTTPKVHADVSDWLKQGGDPAKLIDICREVGPEGTDLDEWDAGELLNSAAPKPRPWLIAGQFCRTFLSGLVAPGDVGKTTLRLTQAIELATGRTLLGLHVFQRCRVLVLSFEDDRAELHRRLLAICRHNNIDPAELRGWLFCRDLNGGPKLAELDSRGRRRQVGQLDAMLRRAVTRLRCDLLILDPFVKLHALEESSNPDMDFVCSLLIKIAQDCNIAVDSPAHTHKGVIQAGDADARRGASAQRDAGRLDYTLTVMSEDEAKQFGIPADMRKSFMRLDKAKANIVRAAKARWFQLVSVSLNNATAQYPEGDEVQAIERWQPPEVWADISAEALNAILDDIEAGLPDGRRYTSHGKAKDREAWKAVQRRCPGKPEAQCREIIREWIKADVLAEDKYPDPVSRKERSGLRVDANKRPRY
jgi:hypothetical protein